MSELEPWVWNRLLLGTFPLFEFSCLASGGMFGRRGWGVANGHGAHSQCDDINDFLEVYTSDGVRWVRVMCRESFF